MGFVFLGILCLQKLCLHHNRSQAALEGEAPTVVHTVRQQADEESKAAYDRFIQARMWRGRSLVVTQKNESLNKTQNTHTKF